LEEVAPSDGALVTVGFIDELVDIGIQIFVIGREEYYSGSVTGEP
jgi:hypothetical protein